MFMGGLILWDGKLGVKYKEKSEMF
jgi:hypothetical protein